MLPDDLKEKGMRKARRRGMSLGELIREALQAHVDTPDTKSMDDPLYRDDVIYKGRLPKDIAKNHDKYLYGPE